MNKYYVCMILTIIVTCSCQKINPLSPINRYEILMLLPVGSESHRNCFLPLAKALADRGHMVTILSGLQKKANHPNITEINHGIDILDENLNMFKNAHNMELFEYFLPKFARELYDIPSVKELYDRRSMYDVIIIDGMFNEPAFPFLEGTKFIRLTTPGILPPTSAILGNVLNPAYVPHFTEFSRPYSFFQRIRNLMEQTLFTVYWRYYTIYPLVQNEFNSRFPNLPPLREIENGMVLNLANTHFSMDMPLPLLPSQVEVGGMHCRAGKKLPKDINEFINGDRGVGVIYFSLGSICKGKTMPEKYKKILIDTFSKLNQRVVWKFEEKLEGISSNVMIREWLPQQDILAHPNVKLFITHGGLLSMQESIYHGKPLLALPIFGDQYRNGQRIANKGFGKYFNWEQLSVDLLMNAINELLNDISYIRNVKMASAAFRDQPTTPVERAVWWTEYVIRNKNTDVLRSPAADLSWVEYLMLDVLLAMHLLLFVLYWMTKKGLWYLCSLCCQSRSIDRKKKRE